ncbi:hypothetical protein [Sporosarcina ureilytica]|uniref:Uncharacterized protein n=1 Tax=Sporosarcina ureilytica TaxID=298596 RepID=A0A1D8JCM2_9BACL|nr:hypothetical protein [Sporosarcina ureilytica]AOV06467.1 hypothetical protein BI350_01830 [Sporosarcina ureilytica]
MSKKKKTGCCSCKYKKKCPQQLTPCEGSQCQQYRNWIASEGYDAQTNIVYNYTQINRYFCQAVEYCQSLGEPFRIATISELELLAHRFTYIDDDGNVKKCPTLVWSRDENGHPIIVRIAPCNGGKVEILRKLNIKKCKVQVICVAPAGG